MGLDAQWCADSEQARNRIMRNIVVALVWILGLGIWLGGFLLGTSIGGRSGGMVGAGLGAALGMMGYSYVKRALQRAQKLRVSVAQPSRDRRPIVLYLRGFDSDPITEQPTSSFEQTTEEEHLARLMEEIGPFVAVGHPEEPLPPLGARRLYLPQDEWKPRVTAMMRQARFVILRLGQTGGLLWEVTTAVEILDPNQLILLVPKGQSAIHALLHEVSKVFPRALPSLAFSDAETLPAGSLVGLVYFEKGWVPKFVEFEDPPLGTESMIEGPFPAAVRIALAPVLARSGVILKAPETGVPGLIFVMALVAVALLLSLLTVRC